MRTLVQIVTYNEASNISRLISEIRKNLPRAAVLVVDDNSPDGTTSAVQAIRERDASVDVICRTDQRGYGSATITGFNYAIERGYEYLLTLDADFSHDPADLPRLLEVLRTADVAVGSRYAGGVRVLNWEVRRLLLSLAANTYVRLLAGLSCVDCTSGFRGYRISALKQVPLDRIRTTGYAFLPELLFNLDQSSVTEVPVCYTERRLGESKMSKMVIVEAFARPWALLFTRIARWGRLLVRAPKPRPTLD